MTAPNPSHRHLVPLHARLEGFKRYDVEELWAEPLDDGTFRLRHVSYLAADWECGDVVRVVSRDHAVPEVDELVMPGGHGTERCVFAASLEPDDLSARLRTLEDFGATAHAASAGFFAIDVRKGGNRRAVQFQLDYWERQGILKYAADHAALCRIATAILDEVLVHSPFAIAREQAVVSIRQIIDDDEPILHVVHDAESGWQFLGWDTPSEDDARVVALERVIANDGSVAALADLPPGYHAWREGGDVAWQSDRY